MVPLIISMAFFMEFVDTTAINTAIPAMAASLQVEALDLKVALISYLLSLAIFIPISGWLADKFGSRNVFIAALSIFTLASLWCGSAHNLIELIIARFVQGMGGALSLPVGRLIIAKSFARQHLITMMSRVVMVGAIGIMLGPVIGGLITTYLSWHWIFWVNLPMGFITIALAFRYLTKSTKKRTVPPLDKAGFLLFGLSLAGIVFGLSALSESMIQLKISLGILVLSILLFIFYFIYSRTKKNPIVKIDLFQIRTFRIAALGNLVSRMGFGGIPFLLPLLLQINFGFSAQLSGLMLSPIALGLMIAKPLFLPLLRAFGYKKLLIGNTFFSGLSLIAFVFVTKTTPLYCIVGLTFFYGFLMSIQYGAMNTLAFAELPEERFSAATSITSTLQQLAQSFGVAISALFVRFFSYVLFGNLELYPQVFYDTFYAIAALTWLTIFVFLGLKKEDGQQMISA